MKLGESAIEEAVESIRAKDVIELSKQLIRIPSVYRSEHRIARYVSRRLEGWGLSPRTVPVLGFGPSIVADVGSEKSPSIVLNGHLDTVEMMNGWKHDPFGASVQNGMLYGLGALDMKCGLACMMIALKVFAETKLASEARVVFQAVSGEEFSGMGTRALIEQGHFKRAKAVLVGEGFGGLNALTIGRRGASYFDIDVMGKSAHGATPELGVNAIADASKIVAVLSKIRLRESRNLMGEDFRPLRESQTVLRIKGGSESLSVPEKASIHLVRFTLPGEARDVESELRGIIDRLSLESSYQVTLETGVDLYHPHLTSAQSQLVKTASDSIERYAGRRPKLLVGLSEADDNVIAHELGIPVICFGPGESGPFARYHQPEEAISIAQLGTAAKVMADVILRLASSRGS